MTDARSAQVVCLICLEMASKNQRTSSLRSAGASAVSSARSPRASPQSHVAAFATVSARSPRASLPSRVATSAVVSARSPRASLQSQRSGSSKPGSARLDTARSNSKYGTGRVFDTVQGDNVTDAVRDAQARSSDSSTPVTVALGDTNICHDELLEIRSLKHPPRVVQRSLEATYMLLMVKELGRPFAAPDWASVQRLLADIGLLNRMLRYDISLLQAEPELLAFLKAEYFLGGTESPGNRSARTPRGRSVAADAEEKLTFERVLRASRAAAALFHWCSTTCTSAEESVVGEVVEKEPEQPPLEPIPPIAAVEVPPPEVVEAPKPQPRADRHFEVLVPSLPYAIATSITLPVIVDIMLARPDLGLELVGTVDPIEGPHKARQRLRNVQEFFEAKGMTYVVKKELRKLPPKGEAGVFCLLHLENDVALTSFFKQQRLQDRSPRIMAKSPRDNVLKDVVEKLEEWFETRMHY